MRRHRGVSASRETRHFPLGVLSVDTSVALPHEHHSLQDKCVTLGSRAAEAEAAVARLQAERDAMAAQLKRAEVLATSELESSAMVYKADADAATKQAAARVVAMQNEQRDLTSRVEQLEVSAVLSPRRNACRTVTLSTI